MNQTKHNRGAAIRAQRRVHDDASKIVDQHSAAAQSLPPRQRANSIKDEATKLKISFLGGLKDVGEKNMAVLEYGDQAIILDCGNNLGVDLPGINYEINDTAYLETIKHKIKAYVITHGHLDHIGGLRHTVPRYPAPIYGSKYTIGVIERSFTEESSDFSPQLVAVNIDAQERLAIGVFTVEFIRVTHSIPDPTAIAIDTPVGRIIATGDFRLDPEPLDNLPSNTSRLRQLGDEGVLLLMSDSSYADSEGRTPTEHTLQDSFHDVIQEAPGRIFVAVFSSNINRTQMIINAAVAAGRHVVLEGRSMLGYVEIAVRQGILKVPKGTIMTMQQASTLPHNQLLVMCTGGQGEPNAALGRMSSGGHTYIQFVAGDTVVISSSPIPGNEVRYDEISNRLTLAGVRLLRHVTHELDGCGPLHVSGHARRDELREMIRLTRPQFFIPVHGGRLRRSYHAELGQAEGIPADNTLLPDNGDSLYFSRTLTTTTGTISARRQTGEINRSTTASPIQVEHGASVPHGSLLIDDSGSVVSGLVVKDRLMLGEAGIVSVMLTIDKKSGRTLTSPDIISRGFVSLRDSEELMSTFRAELTRAVSQRFPRVGLDQFKAELRDFATEFLYKQTGCSPIVIPVVNVVGSGVAGQKPARTVSDQQRFQEMRARLLSRP